MGASSSSAIFLGGGGGRSAVFTLIEGIGFGGLVLDRYGTWEASVLWGGFNKLQSLHFLYCLNIYYAKLSACSIWLNMQNDVVKVMITVCGENFLL